MSFLTVSELSCGYGNRTVLQQVEFSLAKGHLLGLLGANGSGKTTLLRALCGTIAHTGSCRLEGVELESLSPRQIARRCSYIPQRSGISIDISVLDVVLMGMNPWLGLLEHPTAAMRRAALQALAEVGLSDRAQDNYLHLSEGQKQLCILARTLAADARLLLLDEPESALDFSHRYRMLEILRRWVSQGSRGVVAALHDPSLALNCCDDLLIVSGGRVQAMLAPATDPPAKMEQQLSAVYGAVSLHRCADRTGRLQLVMLKEPD